MRAFCNDATGVHHHDAVGLEHGGEAMRDHQRGSALHELVQRGLHRGFALRVERARGLVEQQDGRVAQHRPRDGDALLLAARQPRAALAQFGGEALRQRLDEVRGVRGTDRAGDRFVVRIQAPVAHVLAQAGGEQHRMLRNQRDRLAQRVRGEVFDRHAVHADAPGLHVVEAQQEREHRALAGARRADQRDGLTRANMQDEALQHRARGLAGIGECHVVEPHLAAQRPRQRHRRGRRDDRRRLVQQFGDAAHAAGRTLQLVPDFRQRADRAAGEQRVQHELAERAGAHAPGRHVVRAQPQHQRDRAEDQQDDDGGDDGLRADAPSRGAQCDVQRIAEAAALVGLARVRAHGRDRAQRLGRQCVRIGDRVLAGARDRAQPAPREHDGQHGERNADQRPARQPRAGREQHDHAADHGDRAAQRHRQRRADHAAQQFGVGGEAGNEFAAAGAIVEGGVEREQVAVEARAQVGHHALAQQRDEEEARGRRQRERGGHGEQQHEDAVDGRAAVGEAAIDHVAKGHGQRKRGRRGRRERHQPGHQQRAMPAHEGPQAAQAAQPRGGGVHRGGGAIRHRGVPAGGPGRGWRRAAALSRRRRDPAAGARAGGRHCRRSGRPAVRRRPQPPRHAPRRCR